MRPRWRSAGRGGENRNGHRFRSTASCALCRRAICLRHVGGRPRRGRAGAAFVATGRRSAAGPEVRGVAGRAAATPSSPATAEQHRLPPDSTTRQTLALPRAYARLRGHGRLDGPLFDDEGTRGRRTGYRLNRLSARRWRRRAQPAGDLFLQRRSGFGIGLAAIGRGRTMAARHQCRSGEFILVAGAAAQRGNLARL